MSLRGANYEVTAPMEYETWWHNLRAFLYQHDAQRGSVYEL